MVRITDTTVTAGNVGDPSVAEDLIEDLIDDAVDDDAVDDATAQTVADNRQDTAASVPRQPSGGGGGKDGRTKGNKKRAASAARTRRAQARRAQARRAARRAKLERRTKHASQNTRTDRPTVCGDAAYGTGGFLDHLAEHDIASRCKTQPPTAAGGHFAKDRFAIDLDTDTVTCPAAVTVAIRRNADGDGIAYFADACATCPLRSQCTNAQGGRTIRVGRYEQRLADARRDQPDPTGPTTTGRPAPKSNANSAT